MKKLNVVLAGLILMVATSAVLAEVDPVARELIRNLQQGTVVIKQQAVEMKPQSVAASTNSFTIGNAGGVVLVTASMTSTGSVASVPAVDAGLVMRELLVVNVGTNALVFADSGNLKLNSTNDVTLGQFDALKLYSVGTNWVELGNN